MRLSVILVLLVVLSSHEMLFLLRMEEIGKTIANMSTFLIFVH